MLLTLLRHAKAEPSGHGSDFERALTRRGQDDARRLGRHLAADGPVPQRALVSPARRTRETYELLAGEMGTGPAAELNEALFDATAGELLAAVQDTAAGVERLMVVGHNPAVAELAVALAGDGDLAERRRLAERFPPGSMVVLEFAGGDWREARAGAARLWTLVLPEDLAGV